MNKAALIVEDEPITLKAMKTVLQRKFDVIHTADNGKSGLEMFRNGNYSIVIADLSMPTLTGFEMIKQMRALNPDIAIIVCTAYRDEAINLKDCPILYKPIDVDVLFDEISKLL